MGRCLWKTSTRSELQSWTDSDVNVAGQMKSNMKTWIFHKICQWMERDAIGGIHFLGRNKAPPGNKSVSWGGFWSDSAATPAHLRNTEHKELSLSAAQCNWALKRDSKPFPWLVRVEIQHHKGDLKHPWGLTCPAKEVGMPFLVDWAL